MTFTAAHEPDWDRRIVSCAHRLRDLRPIDGSKKFEWDTKRPEMRRDMGAAVSALRQVDHCDRDQLKSHPRPEPEANPARDAESMMVFVGVLALQNGLGTSVCGQLHVRSWG